eukprot:GHUV01012293.1.p1 GENE.GHUV01012293.1~~GHUV01012293.1.p1  ORF type:complete len:661 (+),score=240.23 GHUV01012293.1:500-2482(+)
MRRSPKLHRVSGSSSSSTVSGYELQLVMEYCPLGSLRAAIDGCLLEDRFTGRPQYLTVLSLALGVARAMHHMHSEGVLHGDLKAGNVLLKNEVVSPTVSSFGGWPGSNSEVTPAREVLVSKVADFGLACRISDQDTHISGVHRGTLSHMSPELLVHGRASRASDVYAMGILLWEMATGDKAFAGVAKAMLGATVVRDRARPEWPSSNGHWNPVAFTAAAMSCDGGRAPCISADVQPPIGYRKLTEACWAHEPQDRPTFAEIVNTLETLLAQEQQQQAAWEAFAQQQQQLAALDRAGTCRKQRTVTFADPPVSGSIFTSSSSACAAEPDCSSAVSDSRKAGQLGSSSGGREVRYTRASAATAVAAVLGLEGYKSSGNSYAAATTAGIETSQQALRTSVEANSSSSGRPAGTYLSSSKAQKAGDVTGAGVCVADDTQGPSDTVRAQQQLIYQPMLPASVGSSTALQGKTEGPPSCGVPQWQTTGASTAAHASPYGTAAATPAVAGSPFATVQAAAARPCGTVVATPFSTVATAAAGPFGAAADSPFGTAVVPATASRFGVVAAQNLVGGDATTLQPAAAATGPFGAAAQCQFGAAAASRFYAAAQSLAGAGTTNPSSAAAAAADLCGAAARTPFSAAATAGASPFGAAAQSPFDQLKDESRG